MAILESGKSDLPSESGGIPPPFMGGHHEGHSLDHRSGRASIRPADTSRAIDPEVIIYRFPGVLNQGASPGVGVTTIFHCTNFSGVTENMRFVTRGAGTNLVSNVAIEIANLSTHTISTHQTVAYVQQVADILNTGTVTQGATAIAATSINIICTAMTIDAAAATPIGVALRGIRFSPVPRSQE